MIRKSIGAWFGFVRGFLGLILRVTNRFHSFFAALDGVRRPDLLYLSSVGIPATKREMAVNVRTDRRVESAAAAAAVGGSDEESEGGDQGDG